MGMYVFISVLILIVCVLMALVVLVQNSKGGGLASNMGGTSQIMGVRKTADFLEKATWGLAIALLSLSLLSVFAIPKNVADNAPKTELSTDNASPLKDATPNQPQPQQQAQPKK